MLANQYEILKRLDPDNEGDYDALLTCLWSGYERDFFQMIGRFDESTPEDLTLEVREILDMFRALSPSSGSDGEALAVRFLGFDAKEELQHFSYARFLIEDRGLYLESKRDEYDTHTEMLSAYRKMLALWKKAQKKYELSAEEIKAIAAEAPRGALW